MWRRQFEIIREGAAKQGTTNSPFMHREPKDPRIDLPAPAVAGVTLHRVPAETALAVGCSS